MLPAESVMVGHPVFITAGVLDNPKLTWPKRFIGDDKPLGRVLRTSADVVDFARASPLSEQPNARRHRCHP